MSASISMCLTPATKWNAKADNRPQAMSLAKKLLANASLTASKPAGDDKDLPSAQKAKIKPTNRMTPVMRCVIDVSAGSGKCIVERSRFTGRLLFTALYTLSWPALRQVGHGPSGRWLLEGARPLPSRARPPICRSRAVDYKNLRPRLQTELRPNTTMVQENCRHTESILRCSIAIVEVDQQFDKPVNILC